MSHLREHITTLVGVMLGVAVSTSLYVMGHQHGFEKGETEGSEYVHALAVYCEPLRLVEDMENCLEGLYGTDEAENVVKQYFK